MVLDGCELPRGSPCIPLWLIDWFSAAHCRHSHDWASRSPTSGELTRKPSLQSSLRAPLPALAKLTSSPLPTPNSYCIWCGCAYDDKADLEANCPGEDEDSH